LKKLKVTDKNSRIRIRVRIRILIQIHQSEVWIRGSGSVPKFRGSATLKEWPVDFNYSSSYCSNNSATGNQIHYIRAGVPAYMRKFKCFEYYALVYRITSKIHIHVQYIPRVPQCLSGTGPCPNWYSPTPSPTSECVPPPEPKRGRGHIRLRVGSGGVPIRTTGEKA
jgi:hypothetical protein